MNWEAIKTLEKMPKLSELSTAVARLFGDYYQLGPHEFAAAPYQWNEQFSEQDYFVSRLFWCPSLGAFRRVALRELESDDNADSPPPDALLPLPGGLTYENILKFISTHSELRHSTDVLFQRDNTTCVGRSICMERFTYFFRAGIVIQPNENLYAVSLDTRDQRWALAG